MAQASRLQREAEARYGTRFTSRNASIVQAYSNVMRRATEREIARRFGNANG